MREPGANDTINYSAGIDYRRQTLTSIDPCNERKLNEWGFRPPLCIYRLKWARRTSWGWWDDTALQTHDSKFEPWRSEVEHATSLSRRLPKIFNLYEWEGKKHFVSLKLNGQCGARTRDFRPSKQVALTTALEDPPFSTLPISSLQFPLSSSSTTSRELLSQFSTCSGWRWLDVV